MAYFTAKAGGLEKARVLLRKGIYFYHHLTAETMEEPFPEYKAAARVPERLKEHFEAPSEKDYRFAKAVSEIWQTGTWGEYTVLYNSLDVLLLADALRTRRQTFFNEPAVRLDLFGSLTSSSFSLASFLYSATGLPWRYRGRKPG